MDRIPTNNAPAARQTYEMRAPCPFCRSERGILTTRGEIEVRSGQACVSCSVCGRHCYNAPKHERGLSPEPVRSESVSPSTRYRVGERAHFRCEFCGRTADDGVTFHVAHLISEKDVREYGLPLRLADYLDNLAWLCAECNLGMGHRTLPLHDLLVLHLRRVLASERAT